MARNPWDNDPIVSQRNPWDDDEIVQPAQTNRQRRGQQVSQTYQTLLRGAGDMLFPSPRVAELAVSGSPLQGLGLADEAVGVLSMALGGDFETARAGEAGRIRQLREDFPVSTFGAEMAGLTGAGMLAAPAAPAAIKSAFASAPVRAGAAVGGGTGAVAGAGEAEGGLMNRVVGGVAGGTVGAGLGSAAPAVANQAGAMLGRLGGAASEAVQGVPAGVRRLFSNADPQASAPTPDGAFYGERLGPRGQELITSLSQRPDDAGRMVQEAARGRAAERAERVMAEVQLRTGDRRGVDALMDGRQARQQASPIFETAAQTPIAVSGELRTRLRELGRQGVSFDVADRTVERGGARLSAFLDDTSPEGTTVPLRALHQLVQDVEDAAGEAFRSGRGNQGRSLANEALALRRTLKEASPEFREASAIWSSQARDQRSFELGQSVFQQGRSRARVELDLRDFLGNASEISASERGAFMAGVLDAIESTTASTAQGGNPASRLTREGVQDRLAIVFGNDTAQQLSEVLTRQNQLADLDRLYQPSLGSQTAARLGSLGAEDRLAAGPLRGGTADTIDAVGGFLSQPVTRTREMLSGAVRGRMPEQEATQLAEVLLDQGSPSQNRAMQMFLRSIEDENLRRQATSPTAGASAGYMGGRSARN